MWDYIILFLVGKTCRHCHARFDDDGNDNWRAGGKKFCGGYGCSLNGVEDDLICNDCLYDPLNCIFSCTRCRDLGGYCGLHGTGCNCTCKNCIDHKLGYCGFYGDHVYEYKKIKDKYLVCGPLLDGTCAMHGYGPLLCDDTCFCAIMQ